MTQPIEQTPDAESVLQALETELKRSMGGLRVPGNPRPYYLATTLRRVERVDLCAAHGAMLRNRTQVRAKVHVDVRVGSRKFDNYVDGGLDVDPEERESTDWVMAPDDLDLTGVRVALWKQIQLKFDEALEDYYEHRKAMVSEYLRDEVESFSIERPTIHREPFSNTPLPVDRWEEFLLDASKRFLDHPDVYDPRLAIQAEKVQRWLVTNEGTKVITEDLYIQFSVDGWVLSEDGVYVEADRQVYARRLEEVPSDDELSALVNEVLDELRELKVSESLGSFVGPALLAGQASATVFHEAFGHRVEGERLVARRETRTFAHKIGESILPLELDVYDDPTQREHNGRRVWGSYHVDDQGVLGQKAELVERGKLKGFLRSRTPSKDGKHSNGHGRHDGLRNIMARMGNLVIAPTESMHPLPSWEQLKAKLIEVAKQQGRKQAVIVQRIRGGETSTDSYDFQVFKGELANVSVVDVETGEERRVRDVELIGTPLSALQRLVACGADVQSDDGYCFAESGAVPVSGLSPAILLSEVELQQRSSTAYHEPLLPAPFADDGSRGRSAKFRKRGTRQPHSR